MIDCIFCSTCHRDREQVSVALQLGREPLDVIARRFAVTEAQLVRHRICLGLAEAPPETAPASTDADASPAA